MKLTKSLLCVASILTLSAPVAFSLGFRIPDQAAEPIARGNAFAATADNPSAVYYNPAGIMQSEGLHSLLSVYAISLQDHVELAAKGRHDSFSNENLELQVAPQSYYTYRKKGESLGFGLGIYAPYGFGVEYADDTPIRKLAKRGRIVYVTINPVVAWQITDTLSVGGGPTINYGQATFTRGIISPGDEFKFKGDDIAVGFDAGVMWNPHHMHHFGLTYHSATSVNFDGYTRVQTNPFTIRTPRGPLTIPAIDSRQDARAIFRIPQNIVLGYSFRPADDWNFEFNLDWTDWHALKTVTIQNSSGKIAVPFNWQSSFLYEFGVTKTFAHGLRLSGGYIYSENSVPNDSFNPGIPDSNRHIFSVGVGQSLERFNWDLGYQYAHGVPRTVSQGSAADGIYTSNSHALTLSFGYNF